MLNFGFFFWHIEWIDDFLLVSTELSTLTRNGSSQNMLEIQVRREVYLKLCYTNVNNVSENCRPNSLEIRLELYLHR